VIDDDDASDDERPRGALALKSLIFERGDDPADDADSTRGLVLVVLAADDRVDEAALTRAISGDDDGADDRGLPLAARRRRARLAAPGAAERAAGCVLGGVPPVGRAAPARACASYSAWLREAILTGATSSRHRSGARRSRERARQ